MRLSVSTILLCVSTAWLVNARGNSDPTKNSGLFDAVAKKVKGKKFGIPPPPSGLSRRATCPAGYYLDNQCQVSRTLASYLQILTTL
jgi:hypothetical protein